MLTFGVSQQQRSNSSSSASRLSNGCISAMKPNMAFKRDALKSWVPPDFTLCVPTGFVA